MLCTLCPVGASVLHLQHKIFLPPQNVSLTCGELVSHMEGVTDLWDCLQLQASFATICGCDPKWVCNPSNDACPMQGDGICRAYNPDAIDDDTVLSTVTALDPDHSLCSNLQADCFDCDPCDAFSYTSCYDCTNSNVGGCLWCPTDAVCSSFPLSTFPPLSAKGSCRGGTATTSTSIDNDDNSSRRNEWIAKVSKCPSPSPSGTSPSSMVFTDPLNDSQQWIVDMIHVESVWNMGYTGQGVRIRINDEGIDDTHPELHHNFDRNASCDIYRPTSVDLHGTSCASIAVGIANNDLCSMGIAFGATVSSCRVLGDGEQAPYPDALTVHLDQQDISSNSLGYAACQRKTDDDVVPSSNHGNDSGHRFLFSKQCPFSTGPLELPCSACSDWMALATGQDDLLDDTCLKAVVDYCSLRMNYAHDTEMCVQYLELFTTCRFNGLPEDYQTQLVRGITHGRNGKGLVFVFAGGNEYSYGEYTNYEGLANTRLTITVGAVNKQGTHASYSNTGASVFVSAPGGDTDSQTNFVTAATGGGCRNANVGTSFATPVVAGVIALMLEANPDLTWRDVQAILAGTSQRVDSRDDSWHTNAANYSHSYTYGFGVVNANDAVTTAINWINLSNETILSADSGSVNQTIDDAATPVSSTVIVKDDVTVESVMVYLDVHHSSRGQLEIVLTSPSGTESILTPGQRPEDLQISQKVRWKLLTVRNWGESSFGTWTLTIRDTEPGDVNDSAHCIDQTFDDDVALDYDCQRVAIELSASFTTLDEACQDPVLAVKCCFCGGGIPRSSYRNVFRSWKLVVYGHDTVDGKPSSDDAPSPTESPLDETFQPSIASSFVTSTPFGQGSLKDDDGLESTPTPTVHDDAAGSILTRSIVPSVVVSRTDEPTIESSFVTSTPWMPTDDESKTMKPSESGKSVPADVVSNYHPPSDDDDDDDDDDDAHTPPAMKTAMVSPGRRPVAVAPMYHLTSPTHDDDGGGDRMHRPTPQHFPS